LTVALQNERKKWTASLLFRFLRSDPGRIVFPFFSVLLGWVKWLLAEQYVLDVLLAIKEFGKRAWLI
jgi:hypothetical protein